MYVIDKLTLPIPNLNQDMSYHVARKSFKKDEVKKMFLNIKCDKESGIKRATILSEMHFKNLRQKVVLLRRTQELAQQIEVNHF